jgi:hypothetical protein
MLLDFKRITRGYIPQDGSDHGEWSQGSQSRQRVTYGNESRGTRNQESLYWRGPATILQTELFLITAVRTPNTTQRKQVSLPWLHTHCSRT